MECCKNERVVWLGGCDDDQSLLSGVQHKAGWMQLCVLESVSLSLPSELTRGSLIRLQQSDNGRVALGTFNEFLQRQSSCGAVPEKKNLCH